MSGTARPRHFAEFMRSMYPAFSRRATQVCVMSSALERIAAGAPDAQAIARTALEQANPFGWNERDAAGAPQHVCGMQGYNGMIDPPCPACEANRTRGAQGMDGAQAAEKLREDTRQNGHCPSCHALHPQHHANCTAGVKGADHQAFSQPTPDKDGAP